MGVKLTDIPFGEELDQGWRPKRDIGTIAQQLLPWSAGLAVFLLFGTLTHVLQCEWPGSPLFWVLRQLGRALLAAIQFVIGIFVWCVSGSGMLIKNISSTVSGLESEIAPGPLLTGLLFGRVSFRILRQSQIASRTAIVIVVISGLIIIAILASIDSIKLCGWLRCTYDLIKRTCR